jgi:hypothetical protein
VWRAAARALYSRLLVMLRAARRLRRPAGTARNYATKAVRSGHGAFYAELLPSMLPVALLGSAVYLVCPRPLSRVCALTCGYRACT